MKGGTSRSRWNERWAAVMVGLALALALLVPATAFAKTTVTLWHSYQGDERRALEQTVARFNERSTTVRINSLWVPYSAFIRRLNQAIPRGHGPDLFIFAHEHIGNWVESRSVAPLKDAIPKSELARFFPTTVEALRYKGELCGLPLAFKSLVLFYNRKLVPQPPKTFDELIAIAKRLTRHEEHRYGLVFKATDFYVHAAFLFGFGGHLFDERGRPRLDTPENVRSLEFVRDLVRKQQIVPRNVAGDLITKLFNSGLAAMVINGPWFLGEIKAGLDFGVAPLPVLSQSGRRPRPFVTVDGIFLSGQAHHRDAAIEAMRGLTRDDAAFLRATLGKQLVANRAVHQRPEVRDDPRARVFRQQLRDTVPMPNVPVMRFVWEPANRALRKVMRGAAEPKAAFTEAQKRIRMLMKPPPPRAWPTPYLFAFGLLLLVGVALWVRRIIQPETLRAMRENRAAYAFAAPATLTLLLLLITPFVMGAVVAFFAYRSGTFTFVGARNFIDVLLSRDVGLTDPLSFYYTFVVTVLWTVLNVAAHLVIGVALAMALRDEWVKLRAFYRVLFILPWAIPNYITALVWRGIFDEEFGSMNALLRLLGAEPVNWFSHFWTSFSANMVTNMWLGFPFMMVVTLGALQAIPRDLEEAAAVDGATPWQRFRHVVLPLLGPALIPAVIMGTVWTFNMFNVIYLVSAGEPDGSTEILISEAYKWAFDRYERYGYASAYALLIFFILLGYSRLTRGLRETGRNA